MVVIAGTISLKQMTIPKTTCMTRATDAANTVRNNEILETVFSFFSNLEILISLVGLLLRHLHSVDSKGNLVLFCFVLSRSVET